MSNIAVAIWTRETMTGNGSVIITFTDPATEIDNQVIVGPICDFRATAPAHPDYTTAQPCHDLDGNICMQHAIVRYTAASA
jgi:hypothetical protein